MARAEVEILFLPRGIGFSSAGFCRYSASNQCRGRQRTGRTERVSQGFFRPSHASGIPLVVKRSPVKIRKNILVVDDEEPIRDLLKLYLEEKGYRVRVASSASEMLSIASELRLHLVILDVVLPDSARLEPLERVKAAHPNLPVIIMTGIGFDEDLLREAHEKKASAFVSKGLPTHQLLMEIQRILGPPEE